MRNLYAMRVMAGSNVNAGTLITAPELQSFSDQMGYGTFLTGARWAQIYTQFTGIALPAMDVNQFDTSMQLSAAQFLQRLQVIENIAGQVSSSVGTNSTNNPGPGRVTPYTPPPVQGTLLTGALPVAGSAPFGTTGITFSSGSISGNISGLVFAGLVLAAIVFFKK